VVKRVRVAELRPLGRTPYLLPTRVCVWTRPVATMNETGLGRSKHLLLRVMLRGGLQGWIEGRECIAGVDTYEVREVAVCIAWPVQFDLPFYII
jgi:hypothetical protein